MAYISLPQYARKQGKTRECVRSKVRRGMFAPEDIKRIKYLDRQYYMIQEDAPWPMRSGGKGGRPKKIAKTN